MNITRETIESVNANFIDLNELAYMYSEFFNEN